MTCPHHRMKVRATECTRCFAPLQCDEIPDSPTRQRVTLGFSMKNVDESISHHERRIWPKIRLCNECGEKFKEFMGEEWVALG